MKREQPRVSRRQLLAGAGAVVATTALAKVSRAMNQLVPVPIVGSGEHTYEVYHDWLVPPPNMAFGDTHGLCQDAKGFIYLSHTVHSSSQSADGVVVYDPKGKFVRSFGPEFRGGSHGLDLRKEGSEEFLYHCDTNRRLVVKTTLQGEPVWQRSFPKEAEVYKDASAWCPTNVAFAPKGDFYVGDGYGSSYVFRYDKNGNYLSTIATPGKEPGQVSCPHGLWVDTRLGDPKLVVADRANRRLQYFSLDGKHLGFVTGGMRLPCTAQFRKDLMLVPDLESVVTLLDKKNRVIAQLGDGSPSNLRGAAREQFLPGKFIHPHDAIFLQTGDILVCEWVPIGRVTLLKKRD